MPRKILAPRQRPSPRQYTDEQKAHALTVLAACGGNVEACSRSTGIPAKTVASWRDRPMSGSVRAHMAIREELMGQTMERMLWFLLRRVKGKVVDAKLPAVMNGIAILFDRLRLLRANPSTQGAAGLGTGGLDLSRLDTDELRTFMALASKAGADVDKANAGPEHEADVLEVGDLLGIGDDEQTQRGGESYEEI